MKKLLDWFLTLIFLFLALALGMYWALETCMFQIFGWALVVISTVSILQHTITLIKKR